MDIEPLSKSKYGHKRKDYLFKTFYLFPLTNLQDVIHPADTLTPRCGSTAA